MTASLADFALASSAGLVSFTFAWSGFAKLGRTTETLQTMVELRVPHLLRRRVFAAVVPAWELILAATLLFAGGIARSTAGFLATGTLVIFTALLIGVLWRGEEVSCGCFGQLSQDTNVTGWSIARNILLLALTVMIAVLAPGRPSTLGAMLQHGMSFTLSIWLIYAIALLIVFALRLRRSHEASRPEDSTSGAPSSKWTKVSDLMGEPIPDVEVVSANGVTVPLTRLGRGMPVMLLFLSAECSTCIEIADRVPVWQTRMEPIRIRILTSSRPDVVADRFGDAASFVRYGSKAAMEALGVRGGPAAVVLGSADHPVVASPVVHGAEGIAALVSTIASE